MVAATERFEKTMTETPDESRAERSATGLELQRSVESRTNRQIRDLRVAMTGDRVVVSGRSRTYYVKQLATQAVFSTAPDIELVNEITVCRP